MSAPIKQRPARGRAVRKMDKPYTCREILHTCSNGWTIERVSQEDFNMEGFFMGHCLGQSSAPSGVMSLREPDGTPHVTCYSGFSNHVVMVGRCNQAPKEKYCKLIQEFLPHAVPQRPSTYQLEYTRPEGETLETLQQNLL